MLQKINDRFGFVADLKEMPKLPINDDGIPELTRYAEALTHAIESGIISKPGKYLVEVLSTSTPERLNYLIHVIRE